MRPHFDEPEVANEFQDDAGYNGDQTQGGGSRAHDGDGSKTANSKEEGPACIACRRKKARCSREQPCSHCVKLDRDCIYDEAKNKPGMRAGAVEQLTQRLVKLENMFLGQSLVWQQVWKHLETTNGGNGSSSAASLTSHTSPEYSGAPDASLQDSVSALGRSLASVGDGSNAANVFDPPRLAKRPRLEEQCPAVLGSSWHLSQPLPNDLVDSLVDIYFERVHPWIPMLHVQRFRQDLADPAKRASLSTILHAITSICLRFSDDPRVVSVDVRKAASKRSREIVILQSMEVFSVVNLQALIICAFDTIASGRGPSSWSIVGSMTRTVEQLQLGVEEEDQRSPGFASNGMMSRINFLPPSRDWCEEEERRRVFWNVMLMDRFCSISTGWNLSLTNADARRRLPCEGGLWEAGERIPFPTPHFGVSDQSGTTADCSLADQTIGPQGQDFLGGFAYVIEATETLSLVTSFCLQQPVDVSRPQQVQLWLMKFKQLDLRLIQWKLFLPERWREACAVNADGNMDPNLTLAHITHNTAVVLLHQGMAYPSPIWQSTAIKLPSSSSAETCMAAAIEVSTIVENYLRNSLFLANHQFAFCLFVCGRMLLANATYFQTPLASPSFDSLVFSLREMAARWDGRPAGANSTSSSSNNLASKFASRLQEARELGSTTYDIRQAAYSEQNDNVARSDRAQYGKHAHMGLERGNCPQECGEAQIGWSPAQMSASGRTDGSSSDNFTLAFPPLPQALQFHGQAQQMQQMQSKDTVPVSLEGNIGHNISGAPSGAAQMGDEQQPLDPDVNDIYAYLNGTFLPAQRISIYSQ